MKEIRIDSISDEDKEVNYFFEEWIPNKLESISINRISINTTGIKIGFYLNSILKAIRFVSKQVYLWCFEINEEELEQIVKSAINSERLTFDRCDIHCSKKINFSATSRYAIKHLDFKNWGSIEDSERKSDWKSDPILFLCY